MTYVRTGKIFLGLACIVTYVIVCMLSTGIGFVQKHCRLFLLLI